VQLNIYVPQSRADLLHQLDEAARRSGRPKNELVLEALERFLRPPARTLGAFALGEIQWSRDELYEDRLS
jgi:hypothetical protein